MHDAVREAVAFLIRSREIRPDSSAGPVDFVLHDVDSEGRAREPPCTPPSTATSNP
ncbi:hypothetical protein [Streptomyces sp. NPDC059262]|uniref:hypothetical protein n=1 Tax=Streptomyces sp. NPDC059262 TaxID=3346797 RepID=UPI00367C5E65